ncbi:MAG: bifunctional diguanylate cyclase/phosphodiesterase [Lysobacteraceae bacterium]
MKEILDELTALPNRNGFMATLQRNITYANENRSQVGLLVIDIDNFAQINGVSGYAFGDHVLKHLATQLRGVARPQDFVARIGDNRFGLILPRILNQGHAELAVKKLLRLLEMPVQLGAVRMTIVVTVGIALCPAHATVAEYLLRSAELALVMARSEGQRYLFSPEATHPRLLSDLWDLELELANAIDRGEMSMYYQPQVRISDRRVIGAEALMRWKSRVHGVVSPNVFVPLAERTGQIRKLTIWAMNTVLRQAAEWKHDFGPLAVSVNMPSGLVEQRDLPELVENALQLWHTDRVKLVLEITERSLMNREHALAKLTRIRNLGVKISIDDFGTGYSCLAYFKNIPADELKIDQSFVRDLLTDTASADITTLIIELAHRFDLSVVGEGIEDLATLEKLRIGGCDIAQGYLFAKAMPSAQFQEWLDTCTPAAPLAAEPATLESLQ